MRHFSRVEFFKRNYKFFSRKNFEGGARKCERAMCITTTTAFGKYLLQI